MKSYLSLVPISARVHRRQSRMTRVCIILAVFLVTVIFSMAEIFMRGEEASLIKRHGDYHLIVKNLSEDQAEAVGSRSDIAALSWYSEINPDADGDYYINGKKTVIYGMDEAYMADIRKYPTEGAYPYNETEVMLSLKAKELFDIYTGDHITLNTPSGEMHYRVSGFCEDDAEFNSIIDGVCMYMDRTAFLKVSSLNSVNISPVYYIRFQDHTDLKEAIGNFREEYGLADEDIKENTVILGLSGASSSQNINALYPLMVITFLLILCSGVFMISSCINSNVSQRTKFFGMMRCIGASKQQIIRFVRIEALNWCKTAIPIGCILGILVSWILSFILRFFVKGEWADIPLFGMSAAAIICGVCVGIITVFIAAHSPARRAARVSPIAAVSGNGGEKNIRHAANTRLFKIETTLGIHHAVSVKKNLILMTGSFALSIILFFAFLACLDFGRRLIPSLNSFTPEVSIVSPDSANSIEKDLALEISEIPGVECAFGNTFVLELPAVINGEEGSIDLISYEEYMLDWSKDSVVSGDLSKVFGDSGYAMTIFNKDSRLNVGDRIRIGDEELEIACVVSEGIWGDARATVVCSEETMMRITGEQNYMILSAKFTKDATEATVDAIRGLAGENQISDRREENQRSHSSYWVIRLAAYGFLAVIFLITMLNIMNSISMSVSARIKQYGAMRAVGMESRQVTGMITAEAAAYVVFGSIVGLVLGLLFHYMIYKTLIISHFGGTWSIPVNGVMVIILLMIASCAAAVYTPSKRIRNMAITDTINEL